MRFSVVTLFPEMLQDFAKYGVISRGIKQDLLQLDCINPRDFTTDPHKTVDDRAYGGGPGMVLQVEPLQKAIQAARAVAPPGVKSQVIALSPQGKPMQQQDINALALAQSHIILVAGRYEGFDARILDLEVDVSWSMGDYVLSGGEIAAMAVIDAVARQIPGVLGNVRSASEDSFVAGLLDHPHYTRPTEYAGLKVPEVLLSGDHQAIKKWRLQQQLGNTWLHRSDLLAKITLSEERAQLLQEFIVNHKLLEDKKS